MRNKRNVVSWTGNPKRVWLPIHLMTLDSKLFLLFQFYPHPCQMCTAVLAVLVILWKSYPSTLWPKGGFSKRQFRLSGFSCLKTEEAFWMRNETFSNKKTWESPVAFREKQLRDNQPWPGELRISKDTHCVKFSQSKVRVSTKDLPPTRRRVSQILHTQLH